MMADLNKSFACSGTRPVSVFNWVEFSVPIDLF